MLKLTSLHFLVLLSLLASFTFGAVGDTKSARSRTYWPEHFEDTGEAVPSIEDFESETIAPALGEYRVPKDPNSVEIDLVARTMAYELKRYADNNEIDLKTHVVTLLHRGRTQSQYIRWLVPHLKRMGFKVCVIRYRPRTNEEIDTVQADAYARYVQELNALDENDDVARDRLLHRINLIDQRRDRMRRKLRRVTHEKAEGELVYRLLYRAESDPGLLNFLERTPQDEAEINYVYRTQFPTQALEKSLDGINTAIESLEQQLNRNDDADTEATLLERLNLLDQQKLDLEKQILNSKRPAERAIRSLWRRVTTSMRIMTGLQEGLSVAFYKDNITGSQRPKIEKQRDLQTGIAMAFIVGAATAMNIPFDDPAVYAKQAIVVNALLEIYGNYYGLAKSACFAQGLQYFADARKRIGINRPFFYFASWAHSVLTSSLYMIAKVGPTAALDADTLFGIFRNSLVGVFAKGPVKLWLAKHQRTGNSAHATDSKGHSLTQTRLYNFAGDALLQILKAADINSDSIFNAQSMLYLGLGLGGAFLALRERAYGDERPKTWTESLGLWKKRFQKDFQAVRVALRRERPKHRCTEIIIREMDDHELLHPLRHYIF